MRAEFSDDGRLTITQRLRYLALNLARNLKPGTCSVQQLRFCMERPRRTPQTASPGRALTEAFLQHQLAKMQVISRSAPDEIYNLSDQSYVGLSFQQPVETLESIAVGTLNVLECMRILGRL